MGSLARSWCSSCTVFMKSLLNAPPGTEKFCSLPPSGNGTPLQYSCLENPMDGGAWWATVHGVARSRTRLSDFTFTFHCHALEKEMATHSSVLAWRIPGMGEPGGLPSMGSHRVGHDWSDLAVAAAATNSPGWPCDRTKGWLGVPLGCLSATQVSFRSLAPGWGEGSRWGGRGNSSRCCFTCFVFRDFWSCLGGCQPHGLLRKGDSRLLCKEHQI